MSSIPTSTSYLVSHAFWISRTLHVRCSHGKNSSLTTFKGRSKKEIEGKLGQVQTLNQTVLSSLANGTSVMPFCKIEWTSSWWVKWRKKGFWTCGSCQLSMYDGLWIIYIWQLILSSRFVSSIKKREYFLIFTPLYKKK